ncbi:MAG: hypothetical protein KAR79_03550, partial [Simkaniaceae bacterium]|nr:hypothetical protein [Simkaniaceae bacterium]
MQIVGIQIDNSKVKWVFLSKNGGKISIERLDTIPIDRPGVDAKTTIASKCAKKNFESVTGISSEDLLIRKVKMKLKNTRAFQKTLPFQLETRLPFPLAEMIILPFDGKEESCFFALSKEKLQEHLEKYRMYGIDPERVSSEVNALTRFGKLIAPEKSTYLIVHVSHKSTTFVLMQSGEIGSSVSVPMGALQESHDQYKKQVDRAVFFLLQGLSVSDVLLTGLIDEASFIKEMMESEGRALIECESYLGIDFKKLQQYAVPIGLGLDAFSEDVKSAQFRKGRQMHPRQKKKLKRKIFSGALLCLLFSGIFVLFAEKKMFYQESLLEKEITHFALEKGFEDRSLFE